MISRQLNTDEYSSNKDLPMKLDINQDKAERELILRQLLFLRQELNELKQIFLASKGMNDLYENDVKSNSYYLPENVNLDNIKNKVKSIDEAKAFALQDDSVGEVSMQDIENEIIERTLIKMDGNRRKAAEALNISERTLYRKIKEYGIKD
tara:strand:- start:200 stop:652 length:453 start_codon:yes stop_codon:yes gene_type:complete